MVNIWLPQGTHIDSTGEVAEQIAEFVQEQPGGGGCYHADRAGGAAVYADVSAETPHSCYAQLLVRVDDYKKMDDLFLHIEQHTAAIYPDVEIINKKIVTGPGNSFKIEARFRGPDARELKKLAQQAEQIIRETPNTRDVRTDWRQPVQVLRPQFAEKQARRVGVTRSDLSQALQWNYGGSIVGLYREGDKLLPIVSRPPEVERESAENLQAIQVWSAMLNRFVPIRQVITGVEPQWDTPLIARRGPGAYYYGAVQSADWFGRSGLPAASQKNRAHPRCRPAIRWSGAENIMTRRKGRNPWPRCFPSAYSACL